jgi:hypothetical protein
VLELMRGAGHHPEWVCIICVAPFKFAQIIHMHCHLPLVLILLLSFLNVNIFVIPVGLTRSTTQVNKQLFIVPLP